MRALYRFLCKVEKILGKGIVATAVVGMAMIAIIIFAQVIFRYVFKNALSWSEELCVYIEVWIIFLTAGYALGKGQHICADFVVQYLPKNVKFFLSKVNSVMFIIFSVFSVRYSWIFLINEKAQKMSSMQVSKSYVYVSLLVGAAIMLFYSILLLLKGKEDFEEC